MFRAEDYGDVRFPHDDAIVLSLKMVVPEQPSGHRVTRVLVDTGSSADILYKDAFDRMGLSPASLAPVRTPLVGFTGDTLHSLGVVTLEVQFGSPPAQITLPISFLVVNAPSGYNAILGRSVLNRLGAVVSTSHLLMKFPTRHGVGQERGDQQVSRACYTVTLQGASHVAQVTTQPKEELAFPNATRVEPDEEVEVVQLDDEKEVHLGANLVPAQKESLVGFLKENMDMFAWDAEDMPGIDRRVAEHRLSLYPKAKPVQQKQRRFGPIRQKVVRDEVEKLKKAKFVREVQYPAWVANPVLVKKSNGDWRMCVDYTDLNKACPKDPFPLPNIDALVDATVGFDCLSFMDAFSGYNQIRMSKDDEEKTTFITSQGLYCYRVMPFGLKNAGATYQRMVNKVFDKQIGRNMEAYVDDMVVKSRNAEKHLDDLKETFVTMREVGMRLNPKKSFFGLSGGKFLGFIISSRGIEMNPTKCKAILDMPPHPV